MIKSFMSYIDVLFPLALGRLTYKCPEDLARALKPGMLVSAPLKKGVSKGIVAAINVVPPPGRIREIKEPHGDQPVLSAGLIELIRWMSEYYIALEGIVLKQTVSHEIFERTGTRKSAQKAPADDRFEPADIPDDLLAPVMKSAAQKEYRAFLMRSPSAGYEFSAAIKLLHSFRNVIVLLPEIVSANMLYNEISRTFGERACLMHGEVSKGRRSENIEGILAGRHDIVVGTRAALFAPLKTVSLIIVLQEHSGSYKLEDGIRYNIRDVAVMRGYIEKAVVFLASIAPSIDSFYNALSKKYALLEPVPAERQKVRTIDMRSARKMTPNISRPVFESVRSRLAAGKRLMFFINRRGHSTVVECSECGHTEDCAKCEAPLVMHKKDNLMKCRLCGKTRGVPDKCGRCGSFRLEMLGAGTEKIQEDLKGLFGVDAPTIDSDSVKKGRGRGRKMQASTKAAQIIIGTKMMTHNIISGGFSAAIVMNIDSAINLPDFRASEKAYMELALIRELIEPGGEAFIQTRFPGNHLFRHIRKDDYRAFASEELTMRKELSFPPYSRLLNLEITGNAALAEKIAAHVNSMQNIEALGPLVTPDKKGAVVYSVLLKSTSRQLLNTTAREIIAKYRNVPGATILPDVDPG